MKIRQLIPYTKKLLKGRRIRTAIICILPICPEIFFRLAEAAIYSLLLYFGEMSPAELFSGRNSVQLSVALVLMLARWVISAPVIYASAFRLSEICSEKPCCTPFSRVLLSRANFRRSLGALIWTKLTGLIALAPAVFFGISAYSMLHGTLGTDEMFMAANSAVLALVSFILWISLKLSFAAVPFILVRYQQKSPLRAVLYSVKFMSGRKGVMLRLAAVYFIPALSIVGLAFALTRIMTAFSLSTDIFIREDEYRERTETDRGNGRSRHAAKLPHRRKRSLKKTPHKA